MLVLAAGCSKDHGTADAGSTLSAQDKALKYTQCMRDHGVQMDDPQFHGQEIDLGQIKETDQSKIQSAEQACAQYKPGRESNGNVPAEKLELLRQMSRCMREHGVENFPDPDSSGKLPVPDSLRSDPQFASAESTCLKQQNTPNATSS
ncbi:hypothetical protein [Dactylosporangium darangshiense]